MGRKIVETITCDACGAFEDQFHIQRGHGNGYWSEMKFLIREQKEGSNNPCIFCPTCRQRFMELARVARYMQGGSIVRISPIASEDLEPTQKVNDCWESDACISILKISSLHHPKDQHVSDSEMEGGK